MSHRVSATVVTGLLVLSSLSARAFSSESTDTARVATAVAKDVRDLADPSPERRAAAELRLYAYGSDAFPAIEAAAQHKDLPLAVATILGQIIHRVQPWNEARPRVA